MALRGIRALYEEFVLEVQIIDAPQPTDAASSHKISDPLINKNVLLVHASYVLLDLAPNTMLRSGTMDAIVRLAAALAPNDARAMCTHPLTIENNAVSVTRFIKDVREHSPKYAYVTLHYADTQHWALAAGELGQDGERRVTVYEPLGSQNLADRGASYVVARELFGAAVPRKLSFPRQVDGTNCGIFVFLYVLFDVLSVPKPLSFSTEQLDQTRRVLKSIFTELQDETQETDVRLTLACEKNTTRLTSLVRTITSSILKAKAFPNEPSLAAAFEKVVESLRTSVTPASRTRIISDAWVLRAHDEVFVRALSQLYDFSTWATTFSDTQHEVGSLLNDELVWYETAGFMMYPGVSVETSVTSMVTGRHRSELQTFRNNATLLNHKGQHPVLRHMLDEVIADMTADIATETISIEIPHTEISREVVALEQNNIKVWDSIQSLATGADAIFGFGAGYFKDVSSEAEASGSIKTDDDIIDLS